MAVILAVTVLTGCISELIYLGNTFDEWTHCIDKIDQLVQKSDYGSALKKSRILEEKWERTAKRVDILLIHDYVDSIGVNLSQMRSHLETKNADMYFSHSSAAKKELASIKGSEYPLIENLL